MWRWRAEGATRTFTLRQEANVITCFAFRNGHIETLHAGRREVVPGQPRILEADIQRIVSGATRKIADLLTVKQADPSGYWDFIAWYTEGYVSKWDTTEPARKRRRPIPHPAAPPVSVQAEAQAIVNLAFRDRVIREIQNGACPELRPDPGNACISDQEMALLMIQASASVAELLSLKQHDPERYHYALSLYAEAGPGTASG